MSTVLKNNQALTYFESQFSKNGANKSSFLINSRKINLLYMRFYVHNNNNNNNK